MVGLDMRIPFAFGRAGDCARSLRSPDRDRPRGCTGPIPGVDDRLRNRRAASPARLGLSALSSQARSDESISCSAYSRLKVDEIQHFTTDRLHTLELYPPDANVLFNAGEYRATTRLWHRRADLYRASQTSALVTPQSLIADSARSAEGATAASTNDVPP